MPAKVMPGASGQATRNLAIVAICIATVLIFRSSFKTAIHLAFSDDRYLQIALAPLACLFLIFRERAEVFAQVRYSPRAGIPLLSAALLPALVSLSQVPGSGLLWVIVTSIFLWIGGFVLCFGVQSFRAGLYPLSCMFLMIPFPSSWIDRVATALQHASAAASYDILRLCGVPVLKHGMQFALPGLTFEIAPECSGIRSSLALAMVAIVAGYLCLRSAWARSALIVLTVPIVILKNAVRIAAIATLGAYVDRDFIDGPFHHQYGGLLFSSVGVVLFVIALAGLQKLERRRVEP